jgi:PAS domain S-box-containing protein
MAASANDTRPADDAEVAALRAIFEGTARDTGDEFFQSLVRNLAQAMDTHYAFVAQFVGPQRVRTLAFWLRDHISENVEWDLPGTPCEDVVRGNLCHHPAKVKDLFPNDKPLVDWGIESYLGVPLRNSRSEHLGHLAVFDERPLPEEPRRLFTFRIFATRVAAELERLQLEQTNSQSEQRYRDLFDEAPIAYVHEDLESRFISANRTAVRILGITPEQVKGFVGLSLVPDTPEAKRRARAAFESIGRGSDTSGVVLELRRQDNGQPIWIQWWSRPDPSGKFTRTMFVDITERVLLEQEQARLQAQNLYLQEEIKSAHNFEEIVGNSSALTTVLDSVARVAPTDSTVLITGETGTGKELIARGIHSRSKRKNKPLIKINCAALPTGLVESELFGHEKGAFTGAIAKRVGRFELADGGTIFLDEIGELPPEVQVKLLRVMQEREFDRIGGTTSIKVDVRVLAATNRDLLEEVRDRRFREDLYYRLSVFPIHLPPLRERSGDLPLLARFLVEKYAARIGRRIDGVSAESMQRLQAYAWPGNVRELENVIERAVILATGPMLDISLTNAAADSKTDNGATLETVERNHILRVLRQTDWLIDGPRGAARILDLHPNTLRSRMKKLDISRSMAEES